MIGIIIGTRPELIKIYPVVNFFKKKNLNIKLFIQANITLEI